MATRPMRNSLLLICLLSAACDCSGGTGGDGGTGGGGTGGGHDGGHDAGPAAHNPDDQCEFDNTKPCAAGTGSCTLAVLSDAGIAKRCILGECDVVLQDCDAGLKCTFEDGGRACVPDGTLVEGDECAMAAATCEHGLVCTVTDEDGGAACTRWCRLDSDCRSGQQCYETLVVDGSDERPLVCANAPLTCNPLTQDCHSVTDGCYPGDQGTGCYAAGSVAVGNTCQFSNDCVKGAACVGMPGATTCRKLCAFPQGNPSCTMGTCTRLTTSMTVGVCL